MFKLNSQTEYSLLALAYLKDQKERVSISTLVKATELPERYLARICAKLVRENILDSKEGRDGGYTLNRNWKNITLYDFLNIFEKDLEIVRCKKEGTKCKYKDVCRHKNFFVGILTNLITKELKNYTLDEVLV